MSGVGVKGMGGRGFGGLGFRSRTWVMTELAHGHRRAHTAPALNTKLCRHAVNYTLLSSDRNSLRLLKDCCSKLTSLTADKARGHCTEPQISRARAITLTVERRKRYAPKTIIIIIIIITLIITRFKVWGVGALMARTGPWGVHISFMKES